MKRKETKHSNEQKDELIGSEEYLMLPEDEREKWTPVKDKYEKVPLWCKISLIVALLSVILYVIICFSPPFADFFNKYAVFSDLFLHKYQTSFRSRLRRRR